MFNPARPYLLYAAFRRHDVIYCWDVRGDTGTPVQKLMTSSEPPSNSAPARDSRGDVERDSTNQKLRFDIDIGGKYLSVGSHVRAQLQTLLTASFIMDAPEWVHFPV